MLGLIVQEIQKTQAVTQKILDEHACLQKITLAATHCIDAIRSQHKIMFAGNGGSAADAQHLAAELVGRLRHDRPAMAGLALTTDTSILTAVGNDYGFDTIFSRQIEALGQTGDVLIAITTSGRSQNILQACRAARSKRIITIGLTGQAAPELDAICDVVLHVPTQETSKIQECHIMIGHILCQLVENAISHAAAANTDQTVLSI